MDAEGTGLHLEMDLKMTIGIAPNIILNKVTSTASKVDWYEQ